MKITYIAFVTSLTALACMGTAFQEKALSSTVNESHSAQVEISTETMSFTTQFKDINLGNTLRPTQRLIANQIRDISGVWDSTEGQINLEQLAIDVSGTYKKRGGVIYKGEFLSDVLKGYWVQNYSDRRCQTRVNGSYYWGKLRLAFNSKSFRGTYGYCNDAPTYRWTGSRFEA